MAEPSTKKQKTEDGAVDTGAKAADKPEEKPKAPEPPKELEVDAPKSSGPKVKSQVTFLTQDTTMNVMQSTSGGILMPVSDGGLRHLLAGARASVGLKAGRYMFEAKILESVARAEDSNKSPKQILKIGFSTAGSSLLMGSAETDIYFDSAGGLYHNKKRIGGTANFSNYSIMAVVLNLDSSSPNANTISLFKDGKRVCQPQELPESLKGQVLYPTVTYRHVAVHVNFGPEAMAALPFTCTMVQDASVKDSTVSTATVSKDGKFEVVFPTCLPDEGGFDWVDMFKAKNPDYTELSDRMIFDWAQRSGLPTSRSGSNDKPDIKFGIPDVESVSVRRMVLALAPLQQRNYIVMEVYGNLVQEARAGNLRRFFDSAFKKVSYVVAGEPNVEFKKKNQQLMLAEKQALADVQFRKEKAEEARKRDAEKKKKLAEKAKKKAEKEKQKKIAELKKTQEKAKKEAAKKKAAAEGKELPEEEPEEEKKDEEMEEESEEEEEPDEPMVQEDPPKVELTAEEKKVVFRKLKDPDMALYQLNTSFTKFSVPNADEGFDEVKYEWTKGSKASEYLKKWILDRKQSSRVEDLVPSAWFKGKAAAWQKTLSAWRKKLDDYKAQLAKKAAEKAAKAAKKAAAEKAAAAKAAAAKAAAEKAKKDGKEEKKEEEKAEEPEKKDEEEEEEEEKEEVDFADFDIFGAEEVADIGGGMPLFKDFGHEDWALMTLGFELHLMACAFKKDCNDEERLGITPEHLPFYYNKYYGKALVNKSFGVDETSDLLKLAKEFVFVNQSKVLESLLDEDMEYPQVFVKITEELRRHRTLLVAMGDESAKLKIVNTGGSWNQAAKGGGSGGGGGGGGGWKKNANWQRW